MNPGFVGLEVSLTTLAPSVLLLSLPQDPQSPVQYLAVGLYIRFHKLLYEVSHMTDMLGSYQQSWLIIINRVSGFV